MIPQEDKENFTVSTFRRMSELVRQSSPYIGAVYVQMGAIVLLGGIGYMLDRWRDSFPLYFVIGIGVGIVVGLYELAKLMLYKK